MFFTNSLYTKIYTHARLREVRRSAPRARREKVAQVPLAGRDILILSKEKPDLADYTPYFREVSEDTLQVRGATFWRIRGHGFDYAAYHAGVLEPARRLWYAIPKWLPDCGCYFEERYFN